MSGCRWCGVQGPLSYCSASHRTLACRARRRVRMLGEGGPRASLIAVYPPGVQERLLAAISLGSGPGALAEIVLVLSLLPIEDTRVARQRRGALWRAIDDLMPVGSAERWGLAYEV